MKYNAQIQQSFSHLEPLVREYASEFERIYKERLREDDFKATGNLINSIETKVKVGDDYYSITFFAKDYFKWVEEGRKSGKWPPREAILKWIRAKKILPHPDREGNLPTENQLAFLIQRSIGENGTIKRFEYAGSHIVAETVEQLNEQYLPLFQEALAEDAEHFIIEAFNGALEPLKTIFG